MTGRTTFSMIVILVAAAAAVFLANLQRPMVDPVDGELAATLTRWAVPVLHTATVSPTLPGEEDGWYSQLPTPVPVGPRVELKETPAPTYEATRIK